jgi:hypothetical protein
MADSNEGASGIIAHGATGITPDRRQERSASVVADFVDAACSAAESLLEKQKRQIAERSGGIADALSSAGHVLETSDNEALARYVKQAGDRLQDFSRQMRERRWDEIIADTQDFARRQPTWFVIGAMAAGFLVGRFIWASTGAEREPGSANRASSSGEPARTVTAAVVSGSATGVGEAAGYAAGSSGTVETR